MSTTFAVKLWWKGIDVAFRSNYWKWDQWLNELAEYLPDDTKLIATDNTPQGIYNIWDFKKLIWNQ